ncbi:MAG TPA: carbohydrate ABC transporter substrate-binding protein [Firmicutes bacterium]|nr:carbohydrate ABC transporter substrate-binding protein [Bacillota bacterium]
MKKRTRVLMLALLAFSILGLTVAAAAQEQVVIKFFHRWPQEPRNSFFYERIRTFEELNPHVKIEVDYVLNDPYKEKIRVLVSTDDLPHVFSSWSHSFAENLVSSDRVKELTGFYQEDPEWAANLMDSQIDGFRFESGVYGVPLTIDGKTFFYNKDIFAKHDLEIPKTFDEFIEVLDQLQAAGYDTPIMEGLTDAWAIAHYLGTIFQRILDPAIAAVDYDPATGEFTDPGYMQGLEAFKTLTDYMGPLATAIDHETARNMFANGQVPIVYMQFAEIKMVDDIGKINFGFFDFPRFADGKGNPTALTGAPEGFMLSKNAPKEAEEFLRFLTSQESAYLFTRDCGQLNAAIGAVDEGNASPTSLAAYEVVLASSEAAPWFDNAVKIEIADAFMRGAQSLAIGTTTPEQIMQRVQAIAAELRALHQ